MTLWEWLGSKWVMALVVLTAGLRQAAEGDWWAATTFGLVLAWIANRPKRQRVVRTSPGPVA